MPRNRAPGQRSASTAVLLPGPQPRSTIVRGAASGMRSAKSRLGRARSAAKRRYWEASQVGMPQMSLPTPTESSRKEGRNKILTRMGQSRRAPRRSIRECRKRRHLPGPFRAVETPQPACPPTEGRRVPISLLSSATAPPAEMRLPPAEKDTPANESCSSAPVGAQRPSEGTSI